MLGIQEARFSDNLILFPLYTILCVLPFWSAQSLPVFHHNLTITLKLQIFIVQCDICKMVMNPQYKFNSLIRNFLNFYFCYFSFKTLEILKILCLKLHPYPNSKFDFIFQLYCFVKFIIQIAVMLVISYSHNSLQIKLPQSVILKTNWNQFKWTYLKNWVIRRIWISKDRFWTLILNWFKLGLTYLLI